MFKYFLIIYISNHSKPKPRYSNYLIFYTPHKYSNYLIFYIPPKYSNFLHLSKVI